MEPFDYQLEFLKKEYDTLNQAIGRMDEATHATKNWTMLIWAGSVSFAMTQDHNLRNYVIFTAIIPLAFWFIDAWWRRIQRQMIFRVNEISSFINGENLSHSFAEKKMVGIKLLDLRSKNSETQKVRDAFASLKRTMWFKTVYIYYLTMILASVTMAMANWFFSGCDA